MKHCICGLALKVCENHLGPIVINFNTAHCVGYDSPSTTDSDAALPETTETSTEPAVAQTTSITPVPLKPLEPTTEETTTG